MNTVDMRAFAWRLAPLQHKLEWDLDAARARLARCAQEQARVEGSLHGLEGERAAQSACAERALRVRVDARALRAALVYLSRLVARIEAERAASRQATAQLEVARAECVAAQRRLDTLLAMKGRTADRYARGMQQRQAAEADAAWLLLRRRRAAAEDTA